MSDVYSERSYGEIEVGFGEKIGILVVDFQLGFTDARFRMGGSAHVERAVENTMRLLEAARACNAPVANCYMAYSNEEKCPHWKVGAVKTDLRRGSEGVELDPRIADHSYDYVFEKWGASAFFMTPLSSFYTRPPGRYRCRHRLRHQRLRARLRGRCFPVRVPRPAGRGLLRRPGGRAA